VQNKERIPATHSMQVHQTKKDYFCFLTCSAPSLLILKVRVESGVESELARVSVTFCLGCLGHSLSFIIISQHQHSLHILLNKKASHIIQSDLDSSHMLLSAEKIFLLVNLKLLQNHSIVIL